MIQTIPLPIIRSFSLHTQQWYMSYNLLTACEQDQFRPDPVRKLSVNVYDIYHCCVYSEKLLMMGRGIV